MGDIESSCNSRKCPLVELNHVSEADRVGKKGAECVLAVCEKGVLTTSATQ